MRSSSSQFLMAVGLFFFSYFSFPSFCFRGFKEMLMRVGLEEEVDVN